MTKCKSINCFFIIWCSGIIAIYLSLLLMYDNKNYKYYVTAPGFKIRGVDAIQEDTKHNILTFEKNGVKYKFVGTYEIKENINP